MGTARRARPKAKARRAAPPRAYTLGARAVSAADTRERILAAAYALFLEKSYDELTLQAVAERAGVALKTVLRRFGSKDALIFEVTRSYAGPRQQAAREVPVGDVHAAARSIAASYEVMMDPMARIWPLEDRVPALTDLISFARGVHRQALEKTFAPYLPGPSKERERRIAALIGATELYVWHMWRRRLGHDAKLCESAMTETLDALVVRWGRSDREE